MSLSARSPRLFFLVQSMDAFRQTTAALVADRNHSFFFPLQRGQQLLEVLGGAYRIESTVGLQRTRVRNVLFNRAAQVGDSFRRALQPSLNQPALIPTVGVIRRYLCRLAEI